MPKRIPAEVLEYLRKLGQAYGSQGGTKAAKNMTAEERKARARKASLAAAKKGRLNDSRESMANEERNRGREKNMNCPTGCASPIASTHTRIELGRPPQYTTVWRMREAPCLLLGPSKYTKKPSGPQSVEGVYNRACCFYPTRLSALPEFIEPANDNSTREDETSTIKIHAHCRQSRSKIA